MKLDFRTFLRNLDGSVIPLGVDEFGKSFGDATLGTVAVEALASPMLDDNGRPQALGGNEAIRRYRLAMAIAEAIEPIEVSVEDIALIKGLIPVKYGLPLIVGQSLELLEKAAPN